jgi:cold shock CspA family protein
MVRGTIKWWDNRKGLGALVSDDAPADVWAHITHFENRDLPPKLHGGMAVEFDYTAAPQDSFSYVAERITLLNR